MTMGSINGFRMPASVAGSFIEVPVWDANADDTLVCRAVRVETPDVKTFVLSAREPRRFAYKPGQFLTFEFVIGGQPIHRCYTISASPTRPDTVSITVKRVPGGPVSNWLHDNFKPGSTIKAVGPMGEFTHIDYPSGKYLFLSGGSGVTPMMSMARAMHDLAGATHVVFVHSARSPEDIIFRTELELMARNNPNFRFAAICENDSSGEAWGGFKGRLSPAMLELIAPDFREREVFVCGPSPYMQAVREMLKAAGFDMARHHEESFNFEELPSSEQAAIAEAEEASSAKVYRVEFAKTRRVIECPTGTSVLDAARRAGLRLPSSCTKGVCGTCKSKLISGTVEMQHGGGIRPREIEAGMRLLCCSKPTSDLVIDR
jgi:ferredoxin-NADP reductase